MDRSLHYKWKETLFITTWIAREQPLLQGFFSEYTNLLVKSLSIKCYNQSGSLMSHFLEESNKYIVLVSETSSDRKIAFIWTLANLEQAL